MTADELADVARRDVLWEFCWDPQDMAIEIVKLRAERGKLQRDLDQAVGYKLATAEETRGDMDRDDG